ncbi:hypothetical protein QFZ20_002861 [Flavobacterium sp. W4I14]|nr:hypothetical protein [Flavobacterium sp. W4I14]
MHCYGRGLIVRILTPDGQDKHRLGLFSSRGVRYYYLTHIYSYALYRYIFSLEIASPSPTNHTLLFTMTIFRGGRVSI